jgi:hypothetical protein
MPESEQRTVMDQNGMLTIIGAITSQAVLITALFYYFGWVYIHSFYAYFGIDTNLLGYSTVDYLLRSINLTFLAFMYLAFTVLALLAFHRLVMMPALTEGQVGSPRLSNAVTGGVNGSAITWLVRPALSRVLDLIVRWVRALGCWRLRPSSARWIIAILRALAIGLVLVVFTGIAFPERFGVPLGLLLPLFLMFSVSTFGYLAYVRSKYSNAHTATARPPAPSRVYILTLLALGLVAGLWAVSLYGDQVGTRLAADFVAELPDQPGVVIYSTERIALNGPGINVSDIAQSSTKYHWQYSGLRLLTHTPDKFLLLPAGWQHGRDRVFLLRDDDSIRIDIIPR